MKPEELAIEIYQDSVMYLEKKIIDYDIQLNSDEYLQRLTYYIIDKISKYDNLLVNAAIRECLRRDLLKYTTHQIDQDDIINHYLEKAKAKIKKEKLDRMLEEAQIELDSLDKVDVIIRKLKTISSIMKNDDDETKIYDGMEVIRDNLENGFVLGGVETGVSGIDVIINGFRNGEIVFVAARPRVGKTAMLCQFAANISRYKKIGIFSAEMNRKLIMNRILACGTGIDSEKLLRIDAGKPDYLSNNEKDLITQFCTINRIIKITDKPNIDVDVLVDKAIEMVRDYKVEIIMIDYVQLLTCCINENRVEQLTYITRTLKGLARTLNIPVVVAAQLNREADGKRPALRDLKGAGSIEEDADMVIFLHVPGSLELDEAITEAIVAKNRNGKVGSTNVIHYKAFSRFEKYYGDVLDEDK